MPPLKVGVWIAFLGGRGYLAPTHQAATAALLPHARHTHQAAVQHNHRGCLRALPFEAQKEE